MSRTPVTRSIVLVLLALVPCTASAAVTWTYRALPNADDSGINLVSMAASADANQIVALDSRKTLVYSSSNFGGTWAVRSAPDSMPSTLDDIVLSADGSKIALSICSKYIYTSTNGGVTWTTRTSAGARHWQSIASSADGMSLAAVENPGYVYTSTDGGAANQAGAAGKQAGGGGGGGSGARNGGAGGAGKCVIAVI